MRIHVTALTEDDLRDALARTTTGVTLVQCDRHASRSHAYAFEVALQSDGTPDQGGTPRRWARSNGERYAASYDDWGWFLSALFLIEPDMKATYYTWAGDFHAKTNDMYRNVA